MSLPTSLTVGVCVHNEADNLPYLFDALIDQQMPPRSTLAEIIVVASGCTDDSVAILRRRRYRDPRIKLYGENTRRGKVSAVNTILKRATGDCIVLISADTIPEEHAVERLLAPFKDPQVGITGAHPVPVDDPSTFMGFVTHLQWELHHVLASKHPKLGEMIAFRNVWRPLLIPSDTVHDEAYLEIFFRSRGYKAVYVPDAIVYNKGPETVREFIQRRRNITAGFVQLWERYNYRPGTSVTISDALTFIISMIRRHPMKTHWVLAGAFLQHLAATLGSRDWAHGVEHPHIWEITRSSKKLLGVRNKAWTVSKALPAPMEG